ncbi:ribosome biogenesis protein SLX9 homolog [Gadus morhua]|uniref:Family with sequence similarity 207 member A n=1 Tax=Gadus morhua TaxID=8049 RepID=A0A8C5AFI3_GADMO|nr:protein FAM207A [Gadus morhua]
MVGKIKHVRPRLHQEAVKLDRPPGFGLSQSAEKTPRTASDGPGAPVLRMRTSSFAPQPEIKPKSILKVPTAFPNSMFAGTKITPEALVQTLKFEEPSDLHMHIKKGQEERKMKPKKEKMKERRDRWLNKISSIKLAREQQAALARRQATPVVGDMKALADALPELSELIGPACAASDSARRNRNRKNRVPVKKKPEPTDFTLMKQSQKRKLLESEMSRFGEAIRSLASRSNPLADIGEQLRKRMRQQEEGHPGPL